MRKRLMVLLLGLAVLAVAALPAAASGGPRVQTYEVTITNVNATQWFTPPVVVTHNRRVDLFESGEPASMMIQQVAENGNLDPLLASLDANRRVHDVQVGLFSDDLPPLGPGESVTVEITATSKTRLLSTVSMLICTNDGFTGVDSIKLPRRIGVTQTHYAMAYDAGTEVNTEDLVDIVPPCQALNGVADDDGAPGTGMSDPALAEGGVIAAHGGVAGIADLTQAAHGWDTAAPVVAVSVTRTG